MTQVYQEITPLSTMCGKDNGNDDSCDNSYKGPHTSESHLRSVDVKTYPPFQRQT